MAKPRVFISSTFYDLKHVRSSLETFIASLGYDPVLSEKGSIAYTPDIALDESCYREAQASDIFVLIVGGRYGSEASESATSDPKTFYDRYDSITRKEYESAIDRNIPVYVLIERAVYSEYETFRKNRSNASISYAHVDSVNIFTFIDYILSRPRNSPVYHFELSTEIAAWLREQWAGLFRDLLRSRTDQAELTSLAAQVADLGNVSATLKAYLEEVVSRVGDEQAAQQLISQEEAKLAEARILAELERLDPIRELTRFNVSSARARDVFSAATSLNDLAASVEELSSRKLLAKDVLEHRSAFPESAAGMNQVRAVLGKSPLGFDTAERVDAESRKHRRRQGKSGK